MVTIEFLENENEVFNEIIENPLLSAKYIKKKNFKGDSDLIQIILGISATSLPFIAKIIIESIRSKKNIEIKYKGTLIKGLSEKNTIKTLEKILEQENGDKKIS